MEYAVYIALIVMALNSINHERSRARSEKTAKELHAAQANFIEALQGEIAAQAGLIAEYEKQVKLLNQLVDLRGK